MALNDKQKQFAKEYIIDLNATQAAIRAGYAEKTAYSQGQRLLKHVEVQKVIQKLKDKRSERTEITADRVLKEFAKIGFANITDFLKVDTSMKQEVVTVGEEKKVIEYASTSVDVFDTDNIPLDKIGAISEIRQTRDGIAVKMHDKVAALNAIGKHLGMFVDKVELDVNKMPTINIKRADK